MKKLTAVTICPGPNIAYFSKVVSLREIVDHIYGRRNILPGTNRPHMFIKELNLNIDYLKEQIDDLKIRNEKSMKEIATFGGQLLKGIEYYRSLSGQVVRSGVEGFLQQLNHCQSRLQTMLQDFSGAAA